MDWVRFAATLLQLVPVVVGGIEQVHGGAKNGATKKQLAQESLSVVSDLAKAVAPTEYHAAIDVATETAHNSIDGVVATMNAAGQLKKKTTAAGK